MKKIHCEQLDNLFNWDTLYSISPQDIKWGLGAVFDARLKEWYKVYDGDWDKKLPIEQDFVHESIHKMFKENVPFEQTSLYISSVKKIKQGIIRWNCTTEEKFKEREVHLRKVYKHIKENGFKTQDELVKDGAFQVVTVFDTRLDDPGVVIDRDGRLLYHNGNHRLPMFRALNIPEIKIKVNARHKEWVEFLEYVKSVSFKMWGENRIYQPVNHIDFNHYNCEWSDYRFKIIKEHLNKDDKTLLDIGALWGYFASSFEKEGLECTAVENNKTFLHIMEKIRKANDQKFKIFDKNIFELDTFNYDVVLAVNIFHHFLKSEQSFNQLTKFLNNLNMNSMYFQVHRPSEPQMIGAYRNFAPKEFIDYIISNSCLTNYEEIGEELGRKIYKLWKA